MVAPARTHTHTHNTHTHAFLHACALQVTAEDAERAQHGEAPAAAGAGESAERSVSSRLQYKESSTKRDMSKMDEKKLEQAERLGMGMGRATTNQAVRCAPPACGLMGPV
jgi:hypothetical protein